MSLYSAINIGKSGMAAFSRALDVISHNVANLNTAGFKLSSIQFRDLFYDTSYGGGHGPSGSALQLGAGAAAPTTRMSFAQGEFRETNSGTDVAIDGNGFFVLRSDGRIYYTRAGQFEFDDDGFLVASEEGFRVAGISEDGQLVDIEIDDLRTSPPTATKTVHLEDNLSIGSTTHEVGGVQVIDSLGETHDLTLVFTNNGTVTPRSWTIEVLDDEGQKIADAGEIRFAGNGSPLEGFSSTTFHFAPENADEMDVAIDMGEPGTFSGATSFSGGATSTLRFADQDGRPQGSLVRTHFDEDGVLVANYSNGAEEKGARLALTWFDDLQGLRQLGGGLFESGPGQTRFVDGARQGVMGLVRSSTIEISNVELTDQFTELIIIQRGFQASSQVLTSANEMLQELIQGTRSRR